MNIDFTPYFAKPGPQAFTSRHATKRFAICFVISSAFTTDTLPATSLIDCSMREATTTTVSILFNDWSSFTLFFSFTA
ncbi:hypothetical protein FXE93_04195 [Vibrio cholerae]|nr:hypothetical protein [Vibrio cholerae]EGR4466814.1 hypothetical protein [Vibrio cholerae]TXY16547.1 hypothetical protein FXE93_04195 [Vibrio cholerae]